MSSPFSVVALVAAYNEADVVGSVVGDLIEQGIKVYFLDDGSTDDTVAAVEPFLGRGVLAIERLQSDGDAGAGKFDWERILHRKAELAGQLDASWFIHHDADEFRESPWPHLSLKDAIRHVDALGFNAIDFIGYDFWPTGERFHPGDDVRTAFQLCTELASHDRVQIRCWKKTPVVDLATSGGHEAHFADRRIFPLPFILRHYPIRGQEHGERKVFRERRNRFLERERDRGWHVQYDRVSEGASFLKDPATLTAFDGDAARIALSLRAVESLDLRVEASEAEVARLAGEIARRDIEFAAKDAEIERRGAELAAREMLISELRQRTTEFEQLHTSMRATLEVHVREIGAQRAENSRLASAIEQRTADIERWQAAVEGLTRRLDELQRSLSWRWTSPARAAIRLIKRGGS